VEEGGEWEATVDKYYKPLEEKINIALAGERVQVADEASDIICEKCGAPMVYKTGRFGKYLACSNYPICTNHRSLKVVTPPKETDEICEKCGGKMVERESRYGKYLSCENFPKCKNTRAINEIVGKCPKCGKDVAKRVSKKGKVFYGCTGYPDCDFLSWDIPSDKKCPKCGAYLLIKEGKDSKTIHCSNSACDFSEKTQ
ncbi:MAG: topoisomerase DNA-binding C4 zinc finger domain-containing protein, partial [Clostridia bacterium]